MQDPERLLDDGSEFERLLLEGGIAERPNASLTRRMALGAGLGGALSYTSSAKAWMQTWWGTTVVFVGVGVGVAGAIALGAQPSRAPERDVPKAPLVSIPVEPASPAPSHRVSADGASEELGASKGPTPSLAIEPGAVSSKRAASAKPGSTLAQEIKALDRVRGLMAQGDSAAALVALDGYDRRFPEGTLSREARVLRARATRER